MEGRNFWKLILFWCRKWLMSALHPLFGSIFWKFFWENDIPIDAFRLADDQIWSKMQKEGEANLAKKKVKKEEGEEAKPTPFGYLPLGTLSNLLVFSD